MLTTVISMSIIMSIMMILVIHGDQLIRSALKPGVELIICRLSGSHSCGSQLRKSDHRSCSTLHRSEKRPCNIKIRKRQTKRYIYIYLSINIYIYEKNIYV